MKTPPRRWWPLLLAVFLLAGCRTYGDYNSEALTLDAIGAANASFAEELERARADLATLEQRAGTEPRLAEAAVAFAGVVAAHELLLMDHTLLAEEAADDWEDDYRALHRAYGAIVTDAQVIRDRYAHVLAAAARQVATAPGGEVTNWSRYQVVPPYYEAIRSANYRLSVTEVLRRAEAAPGYITPSEGTVPDPLAPAVPEAAPDTVGTVR